MGRPEQRNKMSKMARDLIAAGFPHGKRKSRPMPNSGGLTMVNRPGSTKLHRREDSRGHQQSQQS